MDIYVLIRETFNYDMDEYDTKVIVFDSEEGAKNYFEILKESIKADIAKFYGYNSFEEMFNDKFFSSEICISENDIQMFLEIDEEDFDRIYILKQNLMSFN